MLKIGGGILPRKIRLNELIGLQLKEFRTQYQVKGKDVAEHINKSPAYVSKLEKGQIQQIDKKELVEITNFITKSDDGYNLFCEKRVAEANVKDLDNDIFFLNFDLIDRQIPISSELVSAIKSKMEEAEISSEGLAAYINQNEDLTPDFLYEHKIDSNIVEKNIWIPYREADSIEHPHSMIFLEYSAERIEKLINNEINKCEYMFPFAIMYHLLKLSYKRMGHVINDDIISECKIKAEEFLLEYKCYSLAVQARFSEQVSTEDEYMKLLNNTDINNMEYMSEIMSKIIFLTQRDVVYTNEKLKMIVDNFNECDITFPLAFMATSLLEIKDLQSSLKRQFLDEVKSLVHKYAKIVSTDENIEKY